MMSTLEIRRTTESDLPLVADLLQLVFGAAKPLPVLRWILEDPECKGELLSFVAMSGNRVVCHVGYIRALYRCAGVLYTGAHPILWAVDPAHRGAVAKAIYRKVLETANLSVIFEGTPSAIRAYPKLGYKKTLVVSHFRRTISLTFPSSDFSSNSRARSLLRSGKSLCELFWGKLRRGYSDQRAAREVTFSPFMPNMAVEAPVAEIVSHCPTENQIHWLLRCPLNQSQAEVVSVNGSPIGYLVIYWNTSGSKTTGRIIHLPDMGTDIRRWIAVCLRAEKLLGDQSCRSISAMAVHPLFVATLNKLGYINGGARNVWVCDPEGKTGGRSWHLTFLEGDAGYRGV